MKQVEKTIGLSEVVFKDEFYPRAKFDWLVAYGYSQAMKTGALFPPVAVAERKGEYILVDGKHRYEAFKNLKRSKINAIVISGLSDKQIYIEAIKRNMSHGKPLSNYDKALVINQLKQLDYSLKDISKLVQMPITNLQTFIAKRITTDSVGKPVVLKAANKWFAGKIVDVDFDETQGSYNTKDSYYVIYQLIELLKTGSIDISNEKVREKLTELLELLEAVMVKA